ncbi:DNA topoisomerase IV subunit A [Candidatus Nitrosocosmicus sp. T]
MSTAKKREFVTIIKRIMRKISDDVIKQNQMPILDLPKIGYDNTVWSDEKRMLTTGEKKIEVSPDSVKKIPTFAQYLVMANAVKKLIDEDMESTIRGMYYATLSNVGDDKNKQKFWTGQEDSDNAIKAVELLTGIPREEFSVTSKPKGMISGPIKLRVGGDIIDCNLGSRATSQLIPTNIGDVQIDDVKADFVMVVEKDTVLNNIRKSGFIQKYNAILLTGSGEPDRATRMMVKILNEQWKKPVVVFADADPWGLGIALRYKIGSESLSYDSERLVTPNAQVLGMMFSDIYQYNIPEVARLTATDEDINRANDMKKKPWMQNKQWQKELNLFLNKKEKCELDAFFKHGFKYLSETYLPQKLRMVGLI